MHERKNLLSLIIILIILFSASGCSDAVIPPINAIRIYSGFSVHYLDVGQGDAIFIRFPDGKNMLIDTGAPDIDYDNAEYIESYLNAYSVKKIDFLMLTHPDLDHVGNALYILDKFEIGLCFLPFIIDEMLSLFPEFELIHEKLLEKGIQMENPDYYKYILGEEYFMAFLSPSPKTFSDSSYKDLASSIVPTEAQVNNLSPITYLECCGARFVFTGDAENKEERNVVLNYNAGLYDAIFNPLSLSINLENVDYLKVSHHGASDASCSEFIRLLCPKNAIISVGDNAYGHPSSQTLLELQTQNPEYNLFRTDMHGTIAVRKQSGQFVIN